MDATAQTYVDGYDASSAGELTVTRGEELSILNVNEESGWALKRMAAGALVVCPSVRLRGFTCSAPLQKLEFYRISLRLMERFSTAATNGRIRVVDPIYPKKWDTNEPRNSVEVRDSNGAMTTRMRTKLKRGH